MLLRIAKILVAIFLSLIFTISLLKLVICIHDEYYNDQNSDMGSVDTWLEQNNLGHYKEIFKAKGNISLLILFTINPSLTIYLIVILFFGLLDIRFVDLS